MFGGDQDLLDDGWTYLGHSQEDVTEQLNSPVPTHMDFDHYMRRTRKGELPVLELLSRQRVS